MIFHRAAGVGVEALPHRPRQPEALLHEVLQAEPGCAARRRVPTGDLGWRKHWPGVHEGLRVREDSRELHVLKQGAQVVRGIVARAGGRGRGGPASDRQTERREEPDDGRRAREASHASDIVPCFTILDKSTF